MISQDARQVQRLVDCFDAYNASVKAGRGPKPSQLVVSTEIVDSAWPKRNSVTPAMREVHQRRLKQLMCDAGLNALDGFPTKARIGDLFEIGGTIYKCARAPYIWERVGVLKGRAEQ